MSEPKKGYSSNIITAIAAVILLLVIVQTVKFWMPFIGASDIESMVKARDPYKMPEVKPPPSDLEKEQEPKTGTTQVEEENYDPKP